MRFPCLGNELCYNTHSCDCVYCSLDKLKRFIANTLDPPSLCIFIILPALSSQQTVGVIVRLEKEAFKVLTQHGKEVNVPQHAIQLRKTRAVALDNKQNSITSKDVVRVIQGPHLVSGRGLDISNFKGAKCTCVDCVGRGGAPEIPALNQSPHSKPEPQARGSQPKAQFSPFQRYM